MSKYQTKNLISILASLFLTTLTITSLSLFVITSVYAYNNNKMSIVSSKATDLNSLQSESTANPANIETKMVKAGDIVLIRDQCACGWGRSTTSCQFFIKSSSRAAVLFLLLPYHAG